MEETIATIWCVVLRLEHVGRHDNFFEHGGDSLLAADLLTRVQAAFEVVVSLAAIIRNPTVACLAELARQWRAEAVPPNARECPLKTATEVDLQLLSSSRPATSRVYERLARARLEQGQAESPGRPHRQDSWHLLRVDARQPSPWSHQQPPRNTRAGSCSQRSMHHSQMLPCMSNKPRRLGS